MNKDLNWKCRRGMLELDVIFGRFLREHYEKLTEDERVKFETLLEEADPDLYAWMMKAQPWPEEHKEILSILDRDVIHPKDI